VFGVIGGFHLRANNLQTQETLRYFKENKIEIVMPSHCTELPALSLFNQEFGGEQVKSGRLFTFAEV
jgi:7,8-dihydropterin-6-yl-methyl-4-(beta-D-ribofuranosyl)aminobenzene 5'-phosphate synthase